MWKRILLGLSVLVVGFLIWAMWPTSAEDEVVGIAPPEDAYVVTITRDRYGVPHVAGATDADVAYGLAWAHAEDDFLTIQQTLLAARGDLATIEGASAAPIDYFVDLMGIWEAIEERWETLSLETRALLDAYAAGVNHYGATHPDDVLPGVFPVTGQDIVAGFMQKAPLFYGLDLVIASLFAEDSPQPGDVLETRGDFGRFGSNVFAVSPARSSAGQTMLAINSHQPWTGPVAWYEAHLISNQGWNMVGSLFPGMPVIAHGHNRHLGWAFTVSRPDLVDVYWLETNPDNPDQYLLDGEWVDFVIRSVPIEVRLFGRITWTVNREVVRSVHGPVIRNENGSVYAIRYAAMDEVGMVEQLYRMNKAETFDQWRSALEMQSGLPSFNIGYADETGTIAYVHHGLFPDRVEGIEWQGLVDGTDSELIWDAYLPLEALPWVVDPESGYIQNSNSTPFSASGPSDSPVAANFASSMGIPAYETNRSHRLQELLGDDEEITYDEFLLYKWDVRYSPEGGLMALVERVVREVSGDNDREREAIALLETWQPNAASTNRGTALVVRTLAELAERVDSFDPSRLTTLDAVSGPELRAALTTAVEDLYEHHGRVDPLWSEVNRLVRGNVDLGIAGGPDVLHAIYGDWQDGRFVGVGGDSYILIVTWDAAGRVSSSSVHQFGSATMDEDSAHYADQAALFARRQLKPVWLDASDIADNSERTYSPGD